MTDTQKALEAFDNILQQNANLQAIRGYCIINNEDAILIRRALKLAEAVEWRLVTKDGFGKALPPYDGGVYLGYADSCVFSMTYHYKDDMWKGHVYGRFVHSEIAQPTHWQPLPEPPKSHISALEE